MIPVNRITQAIARDRYRMYLEFSDGSRGVVDLSEYAGDGVFSIWDNYDAFKKVDIGSSGELTWSGVADLCPDTLYMKLKDKRPEDVFPSLCREPLHA